MKNDTQTPVSPRPPQGGEEPLDPAPCSPTDGNMCSECSEVETDPGMDLCECCAEENIPEMTEDLLNELARWKKNFVTFAVVHAASYGREHFGIDGMMHPSHYDLLEEAGCCMASFTRAKIEENAQVLTQPKP